MSKGFGSAIPQVDLVLAPFMGEGENVLICMYKGSPRIELKSVARLLCKDIIHVRAIMKNQNIDSLMANDITRGKVELITVEELSSIIYSESVNDNPNADDVFRLASREGLRHEIDTAISKGESSFEFNGNQIDFDVIDGEPYLTLSSLARLTGISENEVLEKIESPEFQRYHRSIQS